MTKEMQLIAGSDFGDTIFEPLIELPQPAKELYVLGEVEKLKGYHMLVVVGSRAHSSYAKEALTKLMGGLSGQRICIVSGLAYGIDSLAHILAMENGLPTIAFLGSGLAPEAIYPAGNKGLANEILSSGGLLVSEFKPTDKAARWTFPKRNRLKAGLADVVLIVEASEKSGTLITARLGLEYNKTLAVIPNSIFSEFSVGSNKLLREGAYPIFESRDILELFNLEQNNEQKEENTKDYSDLSEVEQKVLFCLKEPLPREILQQKSEVEISELNSTLSLLEIKGYTKETAGKIYRT